jgi:hypothetical protein
MTTRWWVAAAIAVAGCSALAARPALIAATRHPAALLAVLFLVLLGVGALLPLPARSVSLAKSRTLVPLVIGVGAFAVGRLVVGGHAPAKWTIGIVAANTLAGVAEEVWFRRVWFGLLEPAGVAIAIAGSAALFAIVHVAIYGSTIIPLDIAAGAILGWQRATTGSWRAPACTHAIANLLVLL